MRLKFNPWVRKIPWRRAWQHTSVFLSGKFHEQRSLAGYSPWSHKESDTTERLSTQACQHRHKKEPRIVLKQDSKVWMENILECNDLPWPPKSCLFTQLPLPHSQFMKHYITMQILTPGLIPIPNSHMFLNVFPLIRNKYQLSSCPSESTKALFSYKMNT